MPKTLTVNELEQQLAQAQQTADKARAAAEAAREKADAERAARLRKLDHDLVEAYDEEAENQRLRDARVALEQAVLNTDLGRAWLDLKLTESRQAHAAAEANAAAQRIGHRRAGSIHTRPASGARFEELARTIDRAANALLADELDAHDDARDAAAEG